MPNSWPPAFPLLISALGGAVGALLIRSLLKLMGKVWANSIPIATYYCGLEQQNQPGVICHGWGLSVPDANALKKCAWQYSTKQVTPDKREHIIFGPYANDFGRPGYYKVTFRISASGLPKTEDPVAVLDVIQAPFAFQRDYTLLGQRIVRANHLTPSYKSFAILCHAAGTGVYEYRCSIPHPWTCDRGSIRFDTIRVYRHVPIWDLL